MFISKPIYLPIARLKLSVLYVALAEREQIGMKIEKQYIERVVDRLPLMTYGLKLSLEA